MEIFKKFLNEIDLNYYEINDIKIGVIVFGMCCNFVKEVFGKNVLYMKLGFINLLFYEKIKEFVEKVDKIYVIEENDLFIEE